MYLAWKISSQNYYYTMTTSQLNPSYKSSKGMKLKVVKWCWKKFGMFDDHHLAENIGFVWSKPLTNPPFWEPLVQKNCGVIL